MSGLDVRDPDVNALLMTEHRETMATAFARHGYRTIAMMPGLVYPWPEGAFYGFQEIYNAGRLNYTGPEFGWWNLSDQFVLAKLDALERNKSSRAPVFVFFPTVNTHMPFVPIPPYQPDWPRMLTDNPFDDDAVARAYFNQPDWLDLGPSYVDAMNYTYEMLAGYLREHSGDDFVMILLGDHQPPAIVSGEGVPWDVPVHVITSRLDVLESLLAHGFRKGITPARPGLGKMHTLTPMLLEAFNKKN
jgi:phosphoglycerol transferase MdoB-like AlkP superfamily enzyme